MSMYHAHMELAVGLVGEAGCWLRFLAEEVAVSMEGRQGEIELSCPRISKKRALRPPAELSLLF